MPAGRPSTYDPAYCDRVIECGKIGMSVVEMCAELDCSRNTIERLWPEAHPEFMTALDKARTLSQSWWERQGRENLGADKFQSALYSRSMAARFPKDWREKSLVGSDPENPLPSGLNVTFKGG